MHRETGNRHQRRAAQMTKWNFTAMGQMGLTGQTRAVAQRVARVAARWTGGPATRVTAATAKTTT